MRRQRKRMNNHFKYNDDNRYNKDILLSYNKTYDDFLDIHKKSFKWWCIDKMYIVKFFEKNTDFILKEYEVSWNIVEFNTKINQCLKNVVPLITSIKFDNCSLFDILSNLWYLEYSNSVEKIIFSINQKIDISVKNKLWYLLSWLLWLSNFKNSRWSDNIRNKILRNLELWQYSIYNYKTVINIVKSLKLNGLKVPYNILELYEESIKQLNVSTSNTELYLFYKLKKLWVEFESNIYIDWFEIDCLLRKYNLIIEIDWPHHEEWKRKWNDKIRDEYFLQKWFQTVRLKDKKDINKAVDIIDQYIYNNKN